MTKVSFGTLDITPTDRFLRRSARLTGPPIEIYHYWIDGPSLRGRKGNAVRQRLKCCQVRSCPRNCERVVLSGQATGGARAACKAGQGSDPRARRPAVGRVDATNIGRSVSVDDPKDESLLVLARAGDRRQVRRGLFCAQFSEIGGR